jgi:hypothetical protein
MLEDEAVTETAEPDMDVYQPSRVRRRSRSRLARFRRFSNRRGTRRRFMIAAIVVLIVAVVGQTVLVVDSLNQLNVSYENFNRIFTSINQKPGNQLTLTDFRRLQSSVRDLSNSITSVQSRLRLIRPLALLNTGWDVQVSQLDASEQLVRASQDMLNGLQPTLFFLLGEDDSAGGVASQISAGARIVELLEIGRGQFLRASNRLETARQILNDIPRGEIAPSLLLQLDTIETFYSQLANTNDLLLEAPELLNFALGLDSQRSYLLLAMNNDEIRPSGGYLSTYGWLVVRDGRIIDYDYSPTTVTSPIPPPPSFADQVSVPAWWIQYGTPVYAAWDGSWYADYPSTAEMAMWYYNNGNNRHSPVSGAIAIDIVGFEYLLEALGSVNAPGFSWSINANNFRAVVYDIRAFGEGVNPHKQFVADVYKEIFAEWQSASSDVRRNNELLSALLQALQERHIMIYFSDPGLNEAVDYLNWSGVQQPTTGHDYLMVADANLGNKSNNSIIRQLTYDVEIQPEGTVQSSITIAYEYPASIANNDPAIDEAYHGPLDYRNLLQVFVPAGSTLSGTNGFTNEVITDVTDHYANFITRVSVEFDSSQRFQLRYTTPQVVEQIGTYERYRLLLQKQPGSRGNRVNVQVSLPPGMAVISTTPTPVQSYNLDTLILDFRLDLNTDQWIEITYSAQD